VGDRRWTGKSTRRGTKAHRPTQPEPALLNELGKYTGILCDTPTVSVVSQCSVNAWPSGCFAEMSTDLREAVAH